MNIFERIGKRTGIIKNERVFSSEYFPTEIISREKEIEQIAMTLRGTVDGRTARVMVFGSTGTGKTTAVKYILKQLSEYTSTVECLHINCLHNSTRYSVLSQMAYAFDPTIPRRGLAPDELLETIIIGMNNSGKGLVVALDEADILIKRGEKAIFYDLLRCGENLEKEISTVLITNHPEEFSALETKIRSSLIGDSVEFGPYSPEQLREILKGRARAGLMPGSYDRETIGACAGFGAKNGGDARIAIRLLWASARIAEKKGKERISEEDIREAKGIVFEEIGEETYSVLSENDKKVLSAIKDGMTTSELYRILDMEKRVVRASLERLERLNIIKLENKGKNIPMKIRKEK